MLARHKKLARLIPIVDNNRISSIKATREVIDMEPLADRFRGFGFTTYDVDGHDVGALSQTIATIRAKAEPSVIVANTVKGKGVPFAENQPIWHYRSLNQALYDEALAALAEDGR